MKERATFTYYKVSNGRLNVALLSVGHGSVLLSTDKVVEEIREQIERILQDTRIDDEVVTITIEAGK